MPGAGIIMTMPMVWVAVINPLSAIIFVGPYREVVVKGVSMIFGKEQGKKTEVVFVTTSVKRFLS
jgi:hypothetical protein